MARERQTLASLLEIALFLIPILLLFQPSHALPLLELHIPSETGLNQTIVLPETVTNHGDRTILCLPVKWTNVIMFFTSNYLLHVGTVRSRPGDAGRANALDVCVALLFPYAGVIRGLEGLLRMPVLTRNQLQRAARAEALCVVTRDQTWTPRRGDRIMMDKRQWAARAVRVGSRPDDRRSLCSVLLPNWKITEGAPLSPLPGGIEGIKEVHGSHHLPPGYTFTILPSTAPVRLNSPAGKRNPHPSMPGRGNPATLPPTISCNYSIFRAISAIGQSVSAAYTIYTTRGDQVLQYGYAAFGLTVIPYVIMSTINFLGNLIYPEYPTLYMVESPEMEEARRRGGYFEGVIGQLDQRAIELLNLDMAEYECVNVRGSSRQDSTWVRPDLPYHYYEVRVRFQADPQNSNKAAEEPVLWIPGYTPFMPPGKGEWNEKFWMAQLIAIVVMAPLPYIIIWRLTDFRKEGSTFAERLWTMAWITAGVLLGTFVPLTRQNKGTDWVDMLLTLALGVGAGGGIYTVANMYMRHGDCRKIV